MPSLTRTQAKNDEVISLVPNSGPELERKLDSLAVTAAAQKRKDIQGLRAIAIIQVLAFHISMSFFTNGFVGVDIFFTLSGFLIAMILSREVQLTPLLIRNFYSRRIKRIFPAYYLTITAVIIASDIYLVSFDKENVMNTAYWAAAFATNLRASYLKSNYESQLGMQNFLLHTWSLSVEIQFYLLAPIFLLISQKIRFGSAVVTAIALLSFYFYSYSNAVDSASFMHCRLWQFYLGAIAYHISKNNLHQSSAELSLNWLWKGLSMGALGVAVITPLIPVKFENQQQYRVIITVAVVFILTTRWQTFTERMLGNRILVFIGDISYSVYLSHWPVILFFRYLTTNVDAVSFFITLFDAFHLTLIISIGSYFFVERYFIRTRFTRTLLFITIAFLITAAAHRFYSNQNERILARWSAEENITDAYINELLHNASTINEPAFSITEDVRLVAIQRNKELMEYKYPNVVWNTEYDKIYTQFFGTNGTSYRGYKQGYGIISVLIFGNQFAHRAFNMIENAVGRNRYREIRLIATNDCLPFLDDAVPRGCLNFSNSALKLIEEAKPHLVFLIFKTMNPLTRPLEDEEIFGDSVYKGMQRMVDRLSEVSTRIVITYNVPRLSNMNNVTERLLMKLNANETGYEEINLRFRDFWYFQQNATRRLDSIVCKNCDRLHPHQWFCAPKYKKCRVYHPGTLVSYFYNDAFLNEYGMEFVSKYFQELIDEYFERQYFFSSVEQI